LATFVSLPDNRAHVYLTPPGMPRAMHRLRVLATHALAALPETGASTSAATAERLQNFIGGEFIPSTASSMIQLTDPASGTVLAHVPESGSADVDKVVAAAANAWPSWRDTPVKVRIEMLFHFKSLLETHLSELSDLIVTEHGKNRAEAEAEVLKGIETVTFALGLPDILAGRQLEVSRGVTCQEMRRPLGVVASIVPFNFPAMVPLWTLPIAIGCGNCLIMKPMRRPLSRWCAWQNC